MPELPEVETVKKILNLVIKGSSIKHVEIRDKNIVKTDLDQFIKTLTGAKVTNVSRIGKYLIFHLNNNFVLVSHLRMEGKYIECLKEEKDSRFARIIFHLTDGRRICYDDSRKFGTMEITTEEDYMELKSLKKLGPEPFFADEDYFYNITRRSHKPIKSLLLDQEVLAGLGNIYVDETLFLSKIHPTTLASSLSKNQTDLLLANAIIVLNDAIAMGGSTIRSYHPGKGISGEFQTKILVYGRSYYPCVNCSTLLKRIEVGGRGTTFCPTCQRKPNTPVIIGITGMIGAGKSSLTSQINTSLYPVYDADKLAKTIYNDKDVVQRIEKSLDVNLKENNEFSLNLLKKSLIANPKLINKVNEIIHPLVKQQIEKLISKNNDKKIVFFEVPLIFSNKINTLFDYIIGVETSGTLQKKYLENRGSKTIVTPDHDYFKNRIKLDFIIINDGNKKDLLTKLEGYLTNISLPL